MNKIFAITFSGFNDNIYHEGNISKMPDFDGFFLFWNAKNRPVGSNYRWGGGGGGHT